MRLARDVVKVCCKMENKWAAPYKAGEELRRKPSNCCQERRDVRCLARKVSMTDVRLSKRCDGNARHMVLVSISQPRTRFDVENTASPLSSFERLMMGRLMD